MTLLNDFIDEMESSCDVKKLTLDEENNSKTQLLFYFIEHVGRYYKEDEIFLNEYIYDTIQQWSHNIDKALKCFQELYNTCK